MQELSADVLNQIVPFSGNPNLPFASGSNMLAQGQPLQQTKTAYTTAVTVQKPRQISTISSNVLQESKLAGSHFFYRWEVYDKAKACKVPIIGPSIDLAMCIARNYGNCVLDVEATETPTHYMLKGIFIDLETGFTCPRLFRQRKKQNISGKMDADRQEDIIFQIGQSKAVRNAIVKAMPAWLIDKAIETAMEAEVASIKPENLPLARSKVISFFSQYGVTADEIAAERNRQPDQWTAKDIVELRATATAIKEGHVSAQEIFTKPKEPNEPDTNSDPAGDDDHGPEGPGGSIPGKTETQKEPPQTGPNPGSVGKQPSVEEARKWCLENRIMGRYFEDKRNFVEVAAASLNIDTKGKLPKEIHLAIINSLKSNSDQADQADQADQTEPDNGSRQELIALYDFFNQISVDYRNIHGGVELFRQAIDAAGLLTGQRPQNREQATKFKEAWEKLLAEHKVSASMSEESDDDLMEALQDLCFKRGTDAVMFEKFLEEIAKMEGLTVGYLTGRILGSDEEADKMFGEFAEWKDKE